MLYIVATPIGDPQEITLRALQVLKSCENIICESTKEASTLLKAHGISGRQFHLLNEHTLPAEVLALVELCQHRDVALVSDCGTPVFCDPGSLLIKECRLKSIPVKSVLGASSLMGLLSLTSEKLKQFLFIGFLPAENEARHREILQLKKEKKSFVLMDTPYRQMKLLNELKEHFPERRILLAQNLSQESEFVVEGLAKDIPKKIKNEKAEFMIYVYGI